MNTEINQMKTKNMEDNNWCNQGIVIIIEHFKYFYEMLFIKALRLCTQA